MVVKVLKKSLAPFWAWKYVFDSFLNIGWIYLSQSAHNDKWSCNPTIIGYLVVEILMAQIWAIDGPFWAQKASFVDLLI